MKNDLKESSKTLEFLSVPKCVIGIDEDKKVHIHDFVQGNNLFISGQVGVGKTVLINEMVKSAMYDKSPNDIQFAFYDPTRMAFLDYKDSPHLIKSIMFETEEFEDYLGELVDISINRAKQIEETETTDIENYNKYAQKNDRKKLPYIVTVIDEMAVLAEESPNVQSNLISLMQKSRELGIYFIISTQIPRRSVICDALKAHMYSRMALKVRNEEESMFIIDEAGAENLEVHGEVIYKTDGYAKVLQFFYN
ncbi:FtsK/SpoIIIE domain-containing protein [Staphylococcus aureus]|nr:FtsK/SpoIIIE domain-containing protein [Staphylococcus aureus]MDN8977798.1 FtsK/SpoIIIE domain-containing protein [Staphylococcus aureus]